jgi:addiction module RelE/StbE family toxin
VAALDDVAGVFAYIARENEKAAMRVVDGLMAAAGNLDAHPQIGRPGRVRGTRELVVGKYIIVYRAKQDVVIIRVIHGARRRS